MKINSRKILTLVIIIAVFVLLVYSGSFSHIRNGMDDKLYGGKKALNNIVIVKIDDGSINNIGRWPWDRNVFAQILDKVKDAKVIGIDVSFFEPSKNDTALKNKLEIMDNVVLAAEINGKDLYKPIFNSEMGYVNFFTDSDGITRSLNPDLHNKIEPFSFMLYKKGWNKNAKLSDDKLYINFAGVPGTFNSISAYGLLNSNESFKDKFVLIGATAPDLHDNYFVPTSEGIAMSGVEIHANVLQNFILNNFIIKENANIIMLLVIIASLCGMFIFSRLKVYYTLPILLAIIGVYFYLSIFLISRFNYLLDLLFFPAALLISTGAGMGVNYLEEKKQNKFISEAFGKYVNKELLNEILSNRKKLELGGIKRNVTIFFSDIRDFTSISEKLSPEELAKFLNEYLSEMTKIILEYKGTVDKFVGDAIMALWNAPIKIEGHAKLACKCALKQAKMLKILSKNLSKKNLPEIKIGCGINTGDVIVGNMGSHDRFDYTAIGDNVNIAARLEGLTKKYGVKIIVSESTYNLARDDFKFNKLDKIKVKGKKVPVTIYELCVKYDEKFEKQFEKGLEFYLDRKFKKAIGEFNKAKKIKKKRKCDVFIERCEKFIKNPPEKNWDGSFEMKTK